MNTIRHATPVEIASDTHRELVTLRHLRRQIDRFISLNQSGGDPLSSKTLARLSLAEAILTNRRRRREVFVGIDFGEPAWEILLELYSTNLRGNYLSVSSLCLASGVPTTTALRWIGLLERSGYLQRLPDPKDRRSTLIRPTSHTIAALSDWLDAHWQTVRGLAYGT